MPFPRISTDDPGKTHGDRRILRFLLPEDHPLLQSHGRNPVAVEPDFFDRPAMLRFEGRSVPNCLNEGPNLSSFDLVVPAMSHVGPAAILGCREMPGPEIVSSTGGFLQKCLEHEVPMVYRSPRGVRNSPRAG